MTKNEKGFSSCIVDVASQVLLMMKENNQLGDKEGVFVSIYDPSRSTETSILTFLVGDVLPSKSKKYRDYSLEKPKRAYEKGHTTSFESRDENLDQWGGGFYLVEKGFGIGVSGLTEEEDMVFSILTAFLSCSIKLKDAYHIIGYSPVDTVLNMFETVLEL